MNIHAVEVERAAGRPLLSGFHTLYSLGGFAGAAFILMLLSFRLGPIFAARAARRKSPKRTAG